MPRIVDTKSISEEMFAGMSVSDTRARNVQPRPNIEICPKKLAPKVQRTIGRKHVHPGVNVASVAFKKLRPNSKNIRYPCVNKTYVKRSINISSDSLPLTGGVVAVDLRCHDRKAQVARKRTGGVVYRQATAPNQAVVSLQPENNIVSKVAPVPLVCSLCDPPQFHLTRLSLLHHLRIEHTREIIMSRNYEQISQVPVLKPHLVVEKIGNRVRNLLPQVEDDITYIDQPAHESPDEDLQDDFEPDLLIKTEEFVTGFSPPSSSSGVLQPPPPADDTNLGKFACTFCNKQFKTKNKCGIHIVTKHLKLEQGLQTTSQSAYDGRFETLTINCRFSNASRVKSTEVNKKLVNILKTKRKKLLCLKWYVTTEVSFTRIHPERESIRKTRLFTSKPIVTLSSSNLVNQVSTTLDKLHYLITESDKCGSGFVLNEIHFLQLNVAKYSPLSGSSYIKLPYALRKKTKSLINITNTDNKCFLYCIAAFLNPVRKNCGRPSFYTEYLKDFKIDGIEFPVAIDQIEKFEIMNEIAVNVFGYEQKEIIPMRLTKFRDTFHECVDLLYITNGNRSHYVLIKDFNKFFSNVTKRSNTTFCNRCLLPFWSRASFDWHYELCIESKVQEVTLPDTDERFEYKNVRYMTETRFVIYADFQSTTNTNQNQMTSFSYVVVDRMNEIKEFQTYRGNDANVIFIYRLHKTVKDLRKFGDLETKSELTGENLTKFTLTDTCCLCDGNFNDKTREKTYNLNYFTASIDVVCSKCDRFLDKKSYQNIQVFVQSRPLHDFNFLIKEFVKYERKKIVTIVSDNFGQFAAVNVKSRVMIMFIDRFQHLATPSLADWVKKLKNSNYQFPLVFSSFSRSLVDLLMINPFYCCGFIDNPEKLNMNALPGKEDFSNFFLNKQTISDNDYQHAQYVWSELGCETFRNFADFCLKANLIIFAEIFQAYRWNIFKRYSIDPAFYCTLPDLSIDCALKSEKVVTNFITDYDQYLFFRKAFRAGFATIAKEYSRANNKCLESYDASKPSVFILNVEKNNLYCAALAQKLPVGGFKWLNETEANLLKIENMTADQNRGYLFEVDLDYPQNLHGFFMEFPPGIEWIHETDQLIASLLPKTNYVLHYRNLKLFMELGVNISKIHRALEFEQKAIYENFIDSNMKCKKNGGSEIEAHFADLLKNCLYLKNVEELLNKTNIVLARDDLHAKRLLNKSTFKSFQVFDNDLVVVENLQTYVKLNRPFACGVVCLELSKLFMYEFYYCYLKRKYGEKVRLLGSDVDSFTFEIETNDLEQDLLPDIETHFDTSNYATSNVLFSLKNAQGANFMKNPYPNHSIVEWKGESPKCYSFQFSKGKLE